MALWGLIFGGVGALAGVAALLYAHIAYRGGKGAGELAVEANNLAKGSNAIALDARQIALEANEYSNRAEQRETERHDVYWDGDWVKPGLYRLVKRGAHEARDVKATVTYEQHEVTELVPAVVNDGDSIDFQIPAAAADFRRIKANQRAARPGPYGLPDTQFSEYHAITERVEWTTPLGKPQLHDPDPFTLLSFDDFL